MDEPKPAQKEQNGPDGADQPEPESRSGPGPSAVASLNSLEPVRVALGDGLTADDPGSEVGPIRMGDDPQSLAPPLSTTFDSTNVNQSGSIPPDPISAAGPSHVVDVVNTQISIFTKGGGFISRTSLASFFSALTPATATFDPKILWDQIADRWLVVTLEMTDGGMESERTSKVFLAVSQTNDPTAGWYVTEIDVKETISGLERWFDYPGFAVDEEAVYITGSMFGFASTGGDFAGSRMVIVDKGLAGGFYDGGVASGSIIAPWPDTGRLTFQPAHVFGTAPAGVGTWLTSYAGLTNGIDEFLQIVRLDDPLGIPSLEDSLVPLGDIEDFTGFPDAPQLGSATGIDTNDRRTLHTVWRDDRLLTTLTINPKAGDADSGEVTAAWIEIDTTTLGSPSLTQLGTIGGEDIASSTHTFFPSIAVNGIGDLGFGFSASAASIFAGSYYTTHRFGSAAGSNTGSQVLRPGEDSYVLEDGEDRNRWGDYSGMAVDPTDQCFWVFNEHALPKEDLGGRWGTAHGKFCISTTFIVTVVDDSPDCSIDTGGGADGVCASCGEACTFRAALGEANALAGLQTIEFAIAGGGPHVIDLGASGVAITDEVLIDGSSDPDDIVVESDVSPTLSVEGDTEVRALTIR